MVRYIQIRQIVFFYILMCVTIGYSILKIHDNYFVCILSYFMVLLCIFFVPSMKRDFEYSGILHTGMYYFSMYIWMLDIVINHKDYRVKFCLSFRIVAILGSLLLILLRRNDYKNVLNGTMGKIPIQKKQFINEIISLSVAILSEEIYFTAFLVCRLRVQGLLNSVCISAFLFVLAHYLNRWAKNMFNTKDYVFIFLLGIFKGIIFYYTNDVLLTILIHFIYNSSEFIVLVKRTRLNDNISNEKSMFDDY